MNNFLQKQFKLEENGTSVKREVLAGLTTFMTMAYILVVNPQVLSSTGMDPGGVFTATILASVFASLIMAFFANYPFVLSAGMGVNAFFAYTLVQANGYSWQLALTAVFIEGIILILLTFLNVRVKVMEAIPNTLRTAITVGIGLYITVIGLSNVGIIEQGDQAILQLGSLTDPQVLLALFGLILTGILTARGFKAAILIGIIATTALSMALGLGDLPQAIVSLPPSLDKVAFKLDFSQLANLDFWLVIIAITFSDLLDTAGTMLGLATSGGLVDEEGRLARANRALLVDGLSTCLGASLGTSTIKTFAESASGIAQGARTGLATLTAGLCFLASLIFYPLIKVIPAAATAPALIIVGLIMCQNIVNIDFSDVSESMPAFLTFIMMPLSYSIVNGIIIGVISYVLIKLFSGKKEDITGLMYVLALVFVLKIIFL